jgi:hypothetical protein
MNMRRPLRAAVLVSLVMMGTLGFAAGGRPADAGCLPSTIALYPITARPGDRFTVVGNGFIAECNDVIVCNAGGCPSPSPTEPATRIRILFQQGGRTRTIATVDAGGDYAFRVGLTVPANARLRHGVVFAEGGLGESNRVVLDIVRDAASRPATRVAPVTGPKDASKLLPLAIATSALLVLIGAAVFGYRRSAGPR